MTKILNRGKFSYNIQNEDFDLVESYLKEVEKRSYPTYKNHKYIVIGCLNYIDKNIQTISMIDVKGFLENVIDNKPIKLDSKETYRSILTSFFYYVQSIYLSRNIEFRNPVPIKRVFQFRKNENDFTKISDIDNKIYSKKSLLEILNISKKHRFRDFIIFSFLTIDGPRISEVLSIRVENINLKERYFETGFTKNARKSNKGLLFFFSKTFKPYLQKYLQFLNIKSGWLFKGRTSHLQTISFYLYVKENYGQKYSRFHTFRRTLITNRIKMGCPLLISEMLMNHKSSSVEGGHYLELSIKEKRDLYDKYFPYYEVFYF